MARTDMAYTHFTRLAALAVGAGSLLLGSFDGDGTARADVEAGAFVGGHMFSLNNELGVPDLTNASGQDATSLRNSVNFGLRFSYGISSMLLVEAEAGLIPTEARQNVFDVWAVAWRAHLIAQFGADNAAKKLIPFVLVGPGAVSVVKTDRDTVLHKDTDEELHLGVGFKYRVQGGLELRFDLRAIFPPSSEDKFAAFDAEALIGVSKVWGKKTEAPPPPPPTGDKDGDGLKDDVDKCVDDPEDMDQFQDDDGCPDPDNDGDGVADAADQCINDPEDVDTFQDEDGCPDPDNDSDGYLDAQDQCPNDAEDKDSFQDDDGCPDPDNDADGIPDTTDQCPDQAETANGYQDDDGCPDVVPAPIKKFQGVIKGITFKNDSDVILKSSNKTLDAAVKVMTDYPDMKIEIQGHTDDTGTEEHNQDLSQRRAEAVMKYFTDHGIDASRLSAVGYGSSQPVIDKKTKAARAKNRRVEFKLQGDQTNGGTITPPPPPPPATQPSAPPSNP